MEINIMPCHIPYSSSDNSMNHLIGLTHNCALRLFNMCDDTMPSPNYFNYLTIPFSWAFLFAIFFTPNLPGSILLFQIYFFSVAVVNFVSIYNIQ